MGRMLVDPERLRERYRGMPSYQLRRIVEAPEGQYTPEAHGIALGLLTERGPDHSPDEAEPPRDARPGIWDSTLAAVEAHPTGRAALIATTHAVAKMSACSAALHDALGRRSVRLFLFGVGALATCVALASWGGARGPGRFLNQLVRLDTAARDLVNAAGAFWLPLPVWLLAAIGLAHAEKMPRPLFLGGFALALASWSALGSWWGHLISRTYGFEELVPLGYSFVLGASLAAATLVFFCVGGSRVRVWGVGSLLAFATSCFVRLN